MQQIQLIFISRPSVAILMYYRNQEPASPHPHSMPSASWWMQCESNVVFGMESFLMPTQYLFGYKFFYNAKTHFVLSNHNGNILASYARKVRIWQIVREPRARSWLAGQVDVTRRCLGMNARPFWRISPARLPTGFSC